MAIVSNFPAIRPSLNLDFANARALDPRITFGRASAATYYDGKTVAKAEENLLLNSAILATQSVTTRAEPYTLSFIGTGTVTLSGTSTAGPLVGTGAANRVSLTFTPTGGTLTLTVTGSVEQAQLEARSVATAYTPTTTQPITNYIPVLQTAPAGVPRFDHNPLTGESLGLLVEEQRTNLFTWSQDFSGGLWGSSTNISVGLPEKTDLFGSVTGRLVKKSGLLGSQSISKAITATAQKYTVTLWVLAGDTGSPSDDKFSFGLFQGAFIQETAKILSGPGTVSGTGLISVSGISKTQVTCVSVTTDVEVSAGALITYIYPATVNADAGGLYIIASQLEAGAFPTSYIKTEASQATRAADSAQMTGANFSSWFSQGEGTLFAESFGRNPNSTPWVVSMYSDLQNYLGIIDNYQSNATNIAVMVSGVSQVFLAIPTSKTGFRKVSMSYTFNNVSASGKGSAPLSDTSTSTPAITGMSIGSFMGSTVPVGGHIKRITYYPKALPGNLQALTA